MIDMVMDQSALRLGNCPFYGMQLGGKVNAGAAAFDHCDDTAQVPFSALQPGCDGGVDGMAVWFVI